ncbi:MAG: hypothetical protein ACE5DI_01225, partial [Candidatus Micrarchaeia archaeon]
PRRHFRQAGLGEDRFLEEDAYRPRMVRAYKEAYGMNDDTLLITISRLSRQMHELGNRLLKLPAKASIKRINNLVEEHSDYALRRRACQVFFGLRHDPEEKEGPGRKGIKVTSVARSIGVDMRTLQKWYAEGLFRGWTQRPLNEKYMHNEDARKLKGFASLVDGKGVARTRKIRGFLIGLRSGLDFTRDQFSPVVGARGQGGGIRRFSRTSSGGKDASERFREKRLALKERLKHIPTGTTMFESIASQHNFLLRQEHFLRKMKRTPVKSKRL